MPIPDDSPAPTPMQPIQPLINYNGRPRFHENAIVRFLLDWATQHGMGLNQIATKQFSNADRQQFAQLIGYSLDGYGELSYVDDLAYETAEAMYTQQSNQVQARADILQAKLEKFRADMLAPIAELYSVHPDDLGSFMERGG